MTSPLHPISFSELIKYCGSSITGEQGCEFKIFNGKYGGPLFSGDDTDGGDHRVWIEPKRNYENMGKERWYIIAMDSNKKEFKIFNKKHGGPLFSGTRTDSSGDHHVWTEPNVSYENAGKERWFITTTNSSNYEFKIFSKKHGGPLFCGDVTDDIGDHYAWTEPNTSYENHGKERWHIHVVS